MSEPRRLLDDLNAPPEAAALLRSLSAPTPPSAAKQAELGRQLAALTSPAPIIAAGASLWVKGALVIGALGMAGAVVWALRPAPTVVNVPTIASSNAPAAVSAPVAANSAVAPVEPAPPVDAARADALPSSASAASAASAGRSKPSPRDNLAEEEALLEQARRLAGSSPGQALTLLQQYQRRFPSGQLAAERMFLSVDVLTRLGKTAAARKQADALMRAFPSSVYAAQVKARSSNP
ncbi:MAG: hypothetical protein ABUL62_24280 [Myxococcales bacterium]|jgi:hypothetical protein